MAYRVSRERFDVMVEKALNSIPRKFRHKLKNIAIIVEDYPSDEVLKHNNVSRYELLGLFVGQSYENQNTFFSVPSPYPDKIYIYQKNIESLCNSEECLFEEIRATILHEIGHYFGMSEEDLMWRDLD